MNIEQELQSIKDRNQRVEADKAWETSLFRITTITLMIYGVAVVVLYFMDVEQYYLSALVPAAGYFLSVQSLPIIKRWWIKRAWKRSP